MILETILLTFGMLILAAIPVLTKKVVRYYGPLFLFGTGALLSLCLFELIPDVFKIGGSNALTLAFGAWVLYSLVHLFHSHHHTVAHDHSTAHDHARDHSVSHRSPYPFFIAITVHCFSSGLFFGISNFFSAEISHAIFVAMVAHKAYESMAVSTLLVTFRRSRFWTLSLIAAYVMSFPIGFVLARIFNGEMTHFFLLIISGVAVGSLLGCLCIDFLVPSYHFIRRSRRNAFWLLLGLLLTLIF